MINRETFLTGLKNQFEDSDAEVINLETRFEKLDTWDSLTKYSIIAFVEDDYKIELSSGQLAKIETPADLANFIEQQLNDN